MVITHKFQTIQELQRLQQLACSLPDEVCLRSLEGDILVDAKSLINLFTLDYSKPVQIVTDAEEVAQLAEQWGRPGAVSA